MPWYYLLGDQSPVTVSHFKIQNVVTVVKVESPDSNMSDTEYYGDTEDALTKSSLPSICSDHSFMELQGVR